MILKLLATIAGLVANCGYFLTRRLITPKNGSIPKKYKNNASAQMKNGNAKGLIILSSFTD